MEVLRHIYKFVITYHLTRILHGYLRTYRCCAYIFPVVKNVRVNLQQITLLSGYKLYILTNNPQYLYHKCFLFSLDIDDFTYISHVQKRQSERLLRREM